MTKPTIIEDIPTYLVPLLVPFESMNCDNSTGFNQYNQLITTLLSCRNQKK